MQQQDWHELEHAVNNIKTHKDILMTNYCLNGFAQHVSTLLRDLSEISRGRGGVETEGGSQFFETAEKGRVMKNGPLKGGGSCKYGSVIM